MNTASAAKELGVSRSHVCRLCREGVLNCRKYKPKKYSWRGRPFLAKEEWDIKELTRNPSLLDIHYKCKGISIGRMRLDLYEETALDQEEILGWNEAKLKKKWLKVCNDQDSD